MSDTHISYIDDFLKLKRIAVIGVSRNEKDYSSMLFQRLDQLDFDVVPVNPHAETIFGKPCVKTVKEIDPAPEGAIALVPDDMVPAVAGECLDAGIKFIWIRKKLTDETLGAELVNRFKSENATVIRGECPFMFLPESEWFHRLHGTINKVMGTYPK